MSLAQISNILNIEVPLPAFLGRPLEQLPVFKASFIHQTFQDFMKLGSRIGLAAKQQRQRPVRRRPQLFSAQGRLAIQSEAWLAIDDVKFQVSEETMIVGHLKSGASARARGILLADGRKLATYVMVH